MYVSVSIQVVLRFNVNFFLETSWVEYNMFLCLLLCTFSADLHFDVNFFQEMSQVKYNMFSCLILCTFSIDLCFDVNFVRKRLVSNIICFYNTVIQYKSESLFV
ncbi:hypothetical protein Hanom_Chr17g01524411 [Helianthus anomalus]